MFKNLQNFLSAYIILFYGLKKKKKKKVHIHRGFLKTVLAELEMLESPSSMKRSFTVVEKTRNDSL